MPRERQGLLRALPRAGRRRRPGAADRAVHVARPLARAALLVSRRAARRPRPDRRDRADQGDRPLRRQPRRRADHLRDAEHHRRDQAPLPRPRLVGARSARAAGAEHPALPAGRGAHGAVRRARRRLPSLPRRPGSPRKRCSRRSRAAAPTRSLSLSAGPARTRTASSIRSSRSAPSEHEYEVSEDRAMLEPGFRVLDERERKILHLRFFEG